MICSVLSLRAVIVQLYIRIPFQSQHYYIVDRWVNFCPQMVLLGIADSAGKVAESYCVSLVCGHRSIQVK